MYVIYTTFNIYIANHARNNFVYSFFLDNTVHILHKICLTMPQVLPRGNSKTYNENITLYT